MVSYVATGLAPDSGADTVQGNLYLVPECSGFWYLLPSRASPYDVRFRPDEQLKPCHNRLVRDPLGPLNLLSFSDSGRYANPSFDAKSPSLRERNSSDDALDKFISVRSEFLLLDDLYARSTSKRLD